MRHESTAERARGATPSTGPGGTCCPGSADGEGVSVTASRSLVVVSAGLSQPSSTRLLADRLSAAVDRHLRAAGIEPQIEVVELRDQAKAVSYTHLRAH